MSTLSLEIEDEKVAQLAEAALARGLTIEELMQQLVDDFLSNKVNFKAAAEYVLNKNVKLYQRLAQRPDH